MVQKAFIKFAEDSGVSDVTLDDVKRELLHYKEQVIRTGKQLDWDYKSHAFPYSIETDQKVQGRFYLKGTDDLHRFVVFGVEEGTVQILLPDGCTHGDKSKANEFSKYLAKRWKAQLHLFNGRTMHFNHTK